MKQRLALGAGTFGTLALVGSLVAFGLSGSGSRPHAARPIRHHTHTVASSSTIAKHHRAGHLCPLTGTPAPGGKVPLRPAEGVKIGNDPASRPQSGLLQADIVYEEMAEGGITRYLAIFQCQSAAQIGPVRSVRWDDWHVLASYGHPILAFSGGINPWYTVVAAQKWLFDANGTFYPTASAYYRTANRVPPWNYYTSSKALWAMDTTHEPPPPQYRYSKRVPTEARPASGVTIDSFSAGVNVVWRWNPVRHDWLRFYDSTPDVDVSGVQLHAANVLIQYVATQPGPYAESGTVHGTDSLTAGTGKAYILRNGHVESGTWSCPAYGDRTTFRFGNGRPMTFTPGNTWVELVPNGYGMQLAG